MSSPKISIIVPIYRVEPYLPRCLDSIVGQTYRHLEIILIDDGSPDGCGAICDDYAARDGRIRVIHQPNQGVSAARNAGLDAATGEWIGWVDGDDWIELDMYEYLLEGVLGAGADIAVCGRWEEYRGRRVFRGWEKEISLDTEQALRALLAKNGTLRSEAAVEEDTVYRLYYDFTQPLSRMQGHQVLAINRGEKEEKLKVSVRLDRELPLRVIMPAFVTSELKEAFTIGFLVYLPFMLIDVVVSSTLMSMGMIMLPPATIALPFKVLLFVSVDGWELLFSSIVKSFS